MRTLTFATAAAGYFPLLQSSADRFGFRLEVLGRDKPWQDTSARLQSLHEHLHTIKADEIIMIVDGYDVVFAGDAEAAAHRFQAHKLPYLLSAQRYFPHNQFMRHLADRVMGIDDPAYLQLIESQPYGRPCMGGIIGYAGAIKDLYANILTIEAQAQSHHDQIPLNRYLQQNPDAAHIDNACNIFQSLWRSRGIFPMKGVFDPHDKTADLKLLASGTLENRITGTSPLMIHAPMNLDINPLLEAMGYSLDNISKVSDINYFRHSIRSYLTIFLQQEYQTFKHLLGM